MELPACRWRGAELSPGWWACASPRMVVAPVGVPRWLCLRCHVCDHEPGRGQAPCRHLGEIVEWANCTCGPGHVRDCSRLDGPCTVGPNNGAVPSCVSCNLYETAATDLPLHLPQRPGHLPVVGGGGVAAGGAAGKVTISW